MATHTPRSLLGTYTMIALLCFLSHAVASLDVSPKVFGIDFSKRVPQNTPLRNLQKRAKTVSIDVDNAQIAYLINMTIGTPPQQFSVQLDTGSSDIWIPAFGSAACEQGPEICATLGAFNYTQSSTFVDVAPRAFQISYADSSAVTGDYMNDTLTIGKTSIQNMTMGLAFNATRPFGIMGIGYVADESIASTDPNSEYPNIIAQLQLQGFINTLAYSLWLNDLNSLTGSILFGGIDTAKFHGSLIVLPVQKSVKDTYVDFTVALSSLSLTDASGEVAFSQSNLALPVILDSGTTATYLPDSVINPILSGAGTIDDPDFGLIVPCSLSSSPANFSFGFGGTGGPTIVVPFGEFVTPIFLQDGSQPIFRKTKQPICSFGLLSSGTGPILFGDTFLRSAYVVYDLTNNQIGMAQTNFNASSSHVVEITGSEIPSAAATATGVAVVQTFSGHPQVSNAPTKAGGAQATGAQGSPTFNLGAGATGSGGKTGAAITLGAPRTEAVTIVTAMVCLISLVFGSSMVLMI